METTTKLQKAGRAFLQRLIAENGPIEAARILRDLADELEALWRTSIRSDGSPLRRPI